MDLNQDLYYAVQKGDLSDIQTLLNRGASVNTTSHENKWSPLHLATYLNRTEVIKLLIKRNADVNLLDKSGNTALHIAFSEGYTKAAEILFKDGPCLTQRNIEGLTPFQVAQNDQPQTRRRGINFEVALNEQKQDCRKCIYEEGESVGDDAIDGQEIIYRNAVRIKRNGIPLTDRSGNPVVNVITKDFSAKLKSNITLSCSVKASPTVDLIKWTKKKDGQQTEIRDVMHASSRYRGSTTENLTITGVLISDSGEYICSARNSYGIGESKPIVLEIDEEKPELHFYQNKYDVKFKSSFTLYCTITAHPKVEDIVWIKNSTKMISCNIQNPKKYCGSKTAHLTINDVEDNDAGVYICRAKNTQGTGQSNPITINVTGGLHDIKNTICKLEQKPKKDDLIECKKEIPLDVTKDLKIGLEVAFGRFKVGKSFAYKHHGIMTNFDYISRTFEIVELTASGTAVNFSAALSGRALKPKILKTSIHFKYEDIFYYTYENCSFSDDLIKERAEMLVRIFDRSDVKYKLYDFNCEHFASYCATGMAFSGQTADVNIEATETLDTLLTSYIDKGLNPDGSHLNIKPENSKTDQCLVM